MAGEIPRAPNPTSPRSSTIPACVDREPRRARYPHVTPTPTSTPWKNLLVPVATSEAKEQAAYEHDKEGNAAYDASGDCANILVR